MNERTICAICAWRGDCKKKFTVESSGQLNCPDYTRDVQFPKDDPNKNN